MARGKRLRLATGIYQDPSGITLRVSVNGEPRESDRYPIGTPLETLIRARKAFKKELEETPPPGRTNTLGALVADYLGTQPKGRTRDDAETLLAYWKEAGFFDRSPDAITAPEIDTQLKLFLQMTKADGTRKFAPKTVKELRRLLGSVFISKYGKGGRNPVRDTTSIVVKYNDPRGFTYGLADFIFARIPDRGRALKGQPRPKIGQTKLRLMTIVDTGLHQIELMRLKEADFRELHKKRIWVEGRKKGKGTSPGWHPLTGRAVKTVRRARAAGVLGVKFSTRSMSKTWNIGVREAKADWIRLFPRRPWPLPANVRPYDLRHTYGTEVYRANKDIRAAQKLLRNNTISVTMRYTLAAVDDQAQAASNALDRAQRRGATTVPRTVPKLPRKTPPISARSGKRAKPGQRAGTNEMREKA